MRGVWVTLREALYESIRPTDPSHSPMARISPLGLEMGREGECERVREKG